MKKSKDELLQSIREHGGDSPDDFVVSLLEDVTDSFVEAVDNSAEIAAMQATIGELTAAKDTLQAAYDAMKRSYADRFTLTENEVKNETETKEDKEREAAESVDSFDSIF